MFAGKENKNKNIIVMYHYINDSGQKNAFSTMRFREQLKFLTKKYQFGTVVDLLEGTKENLCWLTFDDGLKDGIRNAVPIMEEFGAKGLFFVPTSIITEKKIIQAQKRSMIFAKLGREGFLREYNELVPHHYRVTEGKAMDAYNDPKSSLLKYLLDHMEFELAHYVINTIFDRYYNEALEFNNLYLTVDEMKELQALGHGVGTHGHAHRWLGKLYPEDQAADLNQSVEIYRNIFNSHPLVMSYPFGSYNYITTRILEKLGFKAAMLDPTSAVVEESKYEINRVDCVDIKNGQIPDPLLRLSALHA